MRLLSVSVLLLAGCGSQQVPVTAANDCGAACVGSELGELDNNIAAQWAYGRDHLGKKTNEAREYLSDRGFSSEQIEDYFVDQYGESKDHTGQKANEARDYLYDRGVCNMRNGDSCNGKPQDGADGKAGANGKSGADGATGATGSAGATGSDGDDGASGADGQDGADGQRGPSGSAGSNGEDGSDGADGESCRIETSYGECERHGHSYYRDVTKTLVCPDESSAVLYDDSEECES